MLDLNSSGCRVDLRLNLLGLRAIIFYFRRAANRSSSIFFFISSLFYSVSSLSSLEPISIVEAPGLKRLANDSGNVPEGFLTILSSVALAGRAGVLTLRENFDDFEPFLNISLRFIIYS